MSDIAGPIARGRKWKYVEDTSTSQSRGATAIYYSHAMYHIQCSYVVFVAAFSISHTPLTQMQPTSTSEAPTTSTQPSTQTSTSSRLPWLGRILLVTLESSWSWMLINCIYLRELPVLSLLYSTSVSWGILYIELGPFGGSRFMVGRVPEKMCIGPGLTHVKGPTFLEG